MSNPADEDHATPLLPGQIPENPVRARIRELRPWEQEAQDINRPPAQWSPEWVAFRLVDAYQILHRAEQKPGPRGYGRSWVPYIYDRADIQGQGELRQETYDSRNSVRVPATVDEITRSEQAQRWPMTYIVGDELARAVVQMWANNAAREKNRTIDHRKLGASRSACWRARERGLRAICDGLIRDRYMVS